jgi:tetratricopeptide (TPR) repeat protein
MRLAARPLTSDGPIVGLSHALLGVIRLKTTTTVLAQIQGPSGEGSSSTAATGDELSLSKQFFEEWYGNYIIGLVAVLLLSSIVRAFIKSATSMSKYGEGLPTAQRKQIKVLEDAGNLSAAADILYAGGKFDQAAELYTKAEDWVRAGEAFDKAGNVAKAAQLFRRANAIEMAAQVFIKRAQFQLAAKEYMSIESFEKAANAFLKAKDFKSASDCFRKLERWKEAGDALAQAGDSERMAEMYSRYFDAQFEYYRGNLRDMKLACECAQKAAQFWAESGKAEEAAVLYRRAGSLRLAAETYQTIGKLDEAAAIYIEAGRPILAAQMYESAGDESQANRYRAEALIAKGDRLAAAELLSTIGEHHRAAELFNDAGERLRAAESYEEAGEFRLAADLYNAEGEKVRAAAAFERAGEFDQASDIYREVGDHKSEMQAAKAGNNFFRVGEILLEHGRKEDALAAFQRVDPKDQRSDLANLMQGDILRELGRHDVAISKYKAALGEVRPSKGNLDIIYRLAETLEEAGSRLQALRLFESIIGIDFYFKDSAERANELRKRAIESGELKAGTLGTSVAVPGLGGGPPDQDRLTVAPSPAEGSGSPAGRVQSAGSAGSPPPATASSPIPQTAAKRYEMLEEIARGGMGVVLKAKDTVLDRVVAYKILATNLKTNEMAVRYFLREARAAAQMSHPNIVTVFDAGEQDGEFYMAMEYVAGQTLKSLVSNQGAFPEKLVRYLLVHAGKALAYAHDRGLIHRDIKPGNMMLTRDRILKIMDFGLAKFVEEVQANHTKAIGTPYYMSPEQILGKDLDGRSDLYSLGVSMFECATGQVPFAKGDLSYHHLHTAPPSPIDINPKITRELNDIILKCMAKSPEDRFANMNELIASVK